MLRNAPHSTRMIFYVVILLLAALFLPSSALGHKPVLVREHPAGYDRAQPIPDPVLATAYYSELKSRTDINLYTFTLNAETPFYARMNVPKKGAPQDYAPTLVLFGPGLQTSHEPPNYPLDLPRDENGIPMGRAIHAPQGEGEEAFEPFTQITLIQRQIVSKTLPPGTYTLAVYDPSGQSGRYVLMIGSKESYTVLDWLTLPLTWLQVRFWYDSTQTSWVLGGGLLLSVLFAFALWQGKKKSPTV